MPLLCHPDDLEDKSGLHFALRVSVDDVAIDMDADNDYYSLFGSDVDDEDKE